MRIGEFGEEEKALNLVEIVVEKMTIRIGIYNIHISGHTFLKMTLMLLGMIVLFEELREEENKNELLEEV